MSELEMKIEALIRCVPKDVWNEAVAEVSKRRNTVTKNVEDVIREALLEIGMPRHIRGYGYSESAILAIYENPDLIHCIVKGLYTKIADQHKSTPSRVERAIRHSIECAWDRYGSELREKYFSTTLTITKDRPTVSEFLSTMVEIVRMKMR